MSLRATASEKRVAKSMTTRMYLLFDSEGGEMGPIRSTATRLNGSEIIGMRPNGTFLVRDKGSVF